MAGAGTGTLRGEPGRLTATLAFRLALPVAYGVVLVLHSTGTEAVFDAPLVWTPSREAAFAALLVGVVFTLESRRRTRLAGALLWGVAVLVIAVRAAVILWAVVWIEGAAAEHLPLLRYLVFLLSGVAFALALAPLRMRVRAASTPLTGRADAGGAAFLWLGIAALVALASAVPGPDLRGAALPALLGLAASLVGIVVVESRLRARVARIADGGDPEFELRAAPDDAKEGALGVPLLRPGPGPIESIVPRQPGGGAYRDAGPEGIVAWTERPIPRLPRWLVRRALRDPRRAARGAGLALFAALSMHLLFARRSLPAWVWGMSAGAMDVEVKELGTINGVRVYERSWRDRGSDAGTVRRSVGAVDEATGEAVPRSALVATLSGTPLESRLREDAGAD